MQFSSAIFVVFLACLATSQGIALKGVGAEQDASASAPVGSVGGFVDASNGLTVQSGYEGYLIPSQAKPEKSIGSLVASKISFIQSLVGPVKHFLVVYGYKAVAVAVHLGIVLFLGFLASSAVCKFTPLCSGNIDGFDFFKGKFVKQHVKELARSYMTPEKLEIASKLVQSAFDKYGNGPNVEDNETTLN